MERWKLNWLLRKIIFRLIKKRIPDRILPQRDSTSKDRKNNGENGGKQDDHSDQRILMLGN